MLLFSLNFLPTDYLLRFPKIVYFLHTLYLLRLLTTHSMPSRTPSPLVALQAWICHSRSWRWWWPWCFVIEMWIKRSRMMVGDCVLYPLRVKKYTYCFLLGFGHLDCMECHALGHLRWRGRAQEVLQCNINIWINKTTIRTRTNQVNILLGFSPWWLPACLQKLELELLKVSLQWEVPGILKMKTSGESAVSLMNIFALMKFRNTWSSCSVSSNRFVSEESMT